MSENDALDAALDEQRKQSPANSRTALLGNIQTILLIASIVANIYFGFTRVQDAKQQSEGAVRKDINAAISTLLKDSDTSHEAEIAELNGYIQGNSPYLTEILAAYDTKLEKLHSPAEARLIFQGLANGGPDALKVVLDSNRRTYAKLKDIVSGDALYHVSGADRSGSLAGLLPSRELNPIVSDHTPEESNGVLHSLFELETSLDCARLCIPGTSQVGDIFLHREMDRLSGLNLATFHSDLQVAVEVLRGSRIAAQQLLPSAKCDADGAFHLDGLLMPMLDMPKALSGCKSLTFDRSYIKDADLRSLAPSVQHIDFRRTLYLIDPYYDIPYLKNQHIPSPYLSRLMAENYVKLTAAQTKGSSFDESR